ncbi:CusA/CzcA family heavy metal efflux RND transporter [Cytophaga hutchinsonii]|uniref:Cation efflux protein n=1 Tax=Cytophaga hutchinsonii (strain ATCC 33406 / DSM 1761 / CIP 103989 / NBRC 15051 / NCIMB 9469 / D465) TaxID=269798 RepID=A0A6N4SQX5_CYTH3|nr:CusA/CzcA family heavy metal efflux RND transporter [Cytophaga hutchinsonii]ABG58783.1 cation efflux protein [Cytophaga hutchinsonii ATCC 33406]SFX61703.1 cobalt-zinc-cadmium resistance protein CzcA [Cytophaga hutchinsonii ATCC 33406]
MLDKIIHFSIKNKLIIGVFTLALIIWGCWSATKLPIDAVPDITNNQVQVITSSPSLAAQEVERLISFPVEVNMANIPGLIEVRSISRFGLSVVTVVFDDATDIYWARQQVSERLKSATDQIPKGVGVPEMGPVSSGLGEIYQYVIHPKKGYENKYTPMELRTIQDWIVRRQLLGTKGVADVSSFGGFVKQYEISINPDKLRSMNITIGEVFSALETNNQNTGGAYIDKQPNAWFIRTEGLATSIEDIQKVVVKNTNNGTPILIRDVAVVQFGHAVRYGAMTRNNDGEVVGAIVMMLKGANSNEVIGNVKERIEQIRKTLPEGVEIEAFLDRTNLVNRAIHTVSKNLIEGALIVIFVLVLFLGNLRAGLVVASVIPLAMLFALSMMNLFGVSGNLMSLGAIDFGLIVDGAVIIVEATLHHIVSKRYTHKLSQDELDNEVFESASKIRNSAAFGEIIILIVYLPILALVGIEGKMFKPMAQTVAFAILGAFILSLTYVPMISALLLSKNPSHKKNISDKMMDFFYKIYSPAIHFAIKRKIAVVLTSLLLFAVSLFIFMNMGGEFIPTLDEGDFAVETRVLTGSSMMETVDASLKAGEILTKQFPNEVKEVIGKIGAGEIPTDPMPIEACDLMVILKDKDEWTSATTRDELANKMQEALEDIPGVNFGFQQPIQMRFNELMTGAKQDVAIKIYGEDLDILTQQANQLGKIIQTINGAKDLYVEKVTGLPQILVKFDRDKVAQFGLNIEEMNRIVSTAFAGESAGVIYEGERRFDLVLRLNKENRQSIEDVQNLFVTTADGHQIPLSQIAEISFKVGPNQIQRDDTKRRITVAFNVRGRDVESIVKEIQDKVQAQLKLPSGYYLTYGGQFKNLVEAKARLSVAVPIAMALIFILLYFTFNSFKQSILIFTAIPLSAIGGVFALWLRDMPFSISAGVGFIALFGVAVLNGIVLLGEFNSLKKEGLTNLTDIILKGTQTRLRPVLMTATVASLGFLPMALSHGSGAEVQKPLATVVIGGLLSATLLTLLVLPVLYILSENGFKFKTPKVAVILVPLLFMMGMPSLLKAQAPQILSLEQAMQTAVQNNYSIKAAQYNVDYNKNLKGTSTDIGKTSATLMYGQYNSYYNDNNFTISQTIPFPTTMHRQAQYYNAALKSAEYNKDMSENELIRNVKTAYYALQFSKARRTFLLKQDSIFVVFLRSADLRLRTGESNALEKATAESQLYEIRTLIAQNDADIIIYQNQLKTLLNTNDDITTQGITLDKRTLLIGADSAAVNGNPALRYFTQQVQVAEAAKNVERSRLMPDITLGYFNQSLYGTPNYQDPTVVANGTSRFQGVTIGVAIPIWAKPQLAKIKANEAYKNVAQANLDLYEKNLQGEYAQAFQSYLKFKNSLEYYETNALPTADIITKNALANYQSGNIGYIEFSQGLNRALSIQTNYLDIVSQYNQSIINIEFLIGNK